MRVKNEVMKDLSDFYIDIKDSMVRTDIDDIRNKYVSLRNEVKEHCPNSKIFKPKIMTRSIDDYKCPEIAELTLELLLELGK